MEKDLVISFFWIPVVAILALVFVFLGSDSEKKEQTDYKWLMEKIFPIIYEKYIRKKLPSIEFQKNIASLFPNGKKADYGFGIENRVIELYEMEITAIDRLSSKKGKEYLSFKGVCIYNKLNGKYQLISGCRSCLRLRRDKYWKALISGHTTLLQRMQKEGFCKAKAEDKRE